MTASFTLVQLRYFAAVASVENMTAAAAALNVTQSTLSSAISQLERDLDAQLFTRSPRRGLKLTPAGSALLARTAALLEEADLIAQSVRAGDAALSGELTVGVYAPLAPFYAPAILNRCEELHPGLTIEFFEGDQSTLQDALYDGRCEFALMYDLGVDERFDRTVVDRIAPHVIVPENHPIAASHRISASLTEFADEPLVLLGLPHTRDYYLSLFRQLGIAPRVRHVSLGYETVRSFVAQGLGYSVLNQRLDHGATYSGAKVVPLRIEEELAPTEVSIVRRRGLVPTQRSRAVESVCAELASRGSHTSLREPRRESRYPDQR